MPSATNSWFFLRIAWYYGDTAHDSQYLIRILVWLVAKKIRRLHTTVNLGTHLAVLSALATYIPKWMKPAPHYTEKAFIVGKNKLLILCMAENRTHRSIAHFCNTCRSLLHKNVNIHILMHLRSTRIALNCHTGCIYSTRSLQWRQTPRYFMV